MAGIGDGPVLGGDQGFLFPNTRRRASAFDDPLPTSLSRPPTAAEKAAFAEPDTCRICRGEGTQEEPLFYPCKCSGSIKYVHQDCLMEWLSHSQKKHCELCKTPFRFTKLYARDMPPALPIHIFISHLAKYFLRNMLVWLRVALVAGVWLAWLPYLMRSVWSFLFWISEEGLAGGSFARLNGTATAALGPELLPLGGSAVCPSSPLFAATTSVATIGGVVGRGPLDSVPQLVKNLYGINLTLGDPLASTIISLFFGSATLPSEKRTPAGLNSTLISTAVDRVAPLSPSHPSLLSDVEFLQQLTRHPAINRIVIAILEGQIITILVIVCFILIILVRDYVVQQQPEINLRGAFAAENPPPPPQQQQQEAEAAFGIEEGEEVEQAGEFDLGIPEGRERGGSEMIALQDGASEPFLREEEAEEAMVAASAPSWALEEIGSLGDRDGSDRRIGEHNSGLPPGPSSTAPEHLTSGVNRYEASREADASQNPAFGPNGSVGLTDADGMAIGDYLRLYRAAGGDPEKILQLAREQNIEDKLDYWIRLTRAVIDRNRSAEEDLDGPAAADTAAPVSSAERPHAEDRYSDRAGSSEGKGKQKADEVEADDMVLLGTPRRPRANTDGPIVNDVLNPLANNSWSFSDLPREPSAASTSSSSPTPSQTPEIELSTLTAPEVSPPHHDVYPPSPPSSAPAEFGSAEETSSSAFSSTTEAQADEEHEATRPDIPDFDFNTRPHIQHDAPHPRATLADRIADFMWGEMEAVDPTELGNPDDVDELDDGFADGAEEGDDIGDAADRDREVVEAAAAAGIDPDAIDDAEDFEGIMELLGMRGPIAGLFQNVVFCSCLVSLTILVGIFLPYNFGRVSLWLLANPVLLARILFGISKFVQDLALVFIGSISVSVSYLIYLASSMASAGMPSHVANTAMWESLNISANAVARIRGSFMAEMLIITAGEVRNFSAISHEALLVVKGYVGTFLASAVHGAAFLLDGDYRSKAHVAMSLATNVTNATLDRLESIPDVLSHPKTWVINLSLPESSAVVADLELAYWGGLDRFWAVLSGYTALTLLAALYLRRGRPFSAGQRGQEREASLIDLLNQASGVMKVILIIGIEMLAFPLYCGLLLDVALLPLFEDTTARSRMLFTLNYPLTSIFVHWFVGTGYMFHFALFVSMCRKIMRKGVLYFIRDPDDPEFHPVRDVLERSVTTQLRKILFSAFVYGALVIVCLGGVVWGLSRSIPDVLPIHYSSNEPVLEFPIDLLFYNFLMPLAIRFFKPSDGLHAMYTWWFRRCARALRLTWFLFGERRVDEEGLLVLRSDSPHGRSRWRARLFLRIDATGHATPRSWSDMFVGGKAKPTASIPAERMAAMDAAKANLVRTGQLIPDGRFVRAPASDQVKIPKTRGVFLEVTERNGRQDGRPDNAETDIYSTGQYQFVYVPPRFRLRIFLFILFIWIFAAVTGVGFTIVPLVFGRQLFRFLIPAHIRTNDIYAFSIGIYVLGSTIYALFHARTILGAIGTWAVTTTVSIADSDAVRRTAGAILRVAKLLYAYSFLVVLSPLLVTSLMELYLLIPLNTYMYSGVIAKVPSADPAEASLELAPRHTVRAMQAWTIGVLYLKLAIRLVKGWYPETRLAAAVHAVLRHGWLEPDVSILTRAFIIPGLLLWCAAVCAPLLAARALVSHGAADALLSSVTAAGTADPQLVQAARVIVYRFSFPAAALAAAALWVFWGTVGLLRGWKVRIRDEVYLIGERLHNFGVGQNLHVRAGGAWGADGGRRI